MPGNYPATLRAVLQKRVNWTEVTLFTHLLSVLKMTPQSSATFYGDQSILGSQ